MMMRNKLAALLLLAAGCGSTTDAADRGECPQTREFSNHGCARVLAVVQPPAQLPAKYRYDVRAVPARGSSRDPLAFALVTTPGEVPLQITLWSPLPNWADTISVWVVARLLEETPGAASLTTFAADSVLRLARFAPVGAVPKTDTVPLTLRRP
jgi:hypothetical protein